MNLKRLVEISPLILAFLIFNGFLKLYIFYGHWGIRIIDYLDFSEILLSFLNDLNIIVLCLIIFLLHQILGFKLLQTADKKLDGKIPNVFESTPKNETEGLEKKYLTSPISYIVNFFHYKKPWIEVLILVLPGSFFVWRFFASNNLIWLYLSIFGLSKLIIIIIENSIDGVTKLSAEFSIILSFIAFTVGLSIYDIKNVSINANYTTTILVDNETINTTPSNYVIGKTQKFIYIFDDTKHRTRIIPVEKIKNIETTIH